MLTPLNSSTAHIGQLLERGDEFSEDLLDKANVIVLVLDPQGRIVRYNRCLEEMSGRPLEEMRNANWFEHFVPHEEHPQVHKVFAHALDGKPTIGHSNPILCKDGQTRQIEWYSNTLLNEDSGEAAGVVAIGLDVSERVHLEEQFLQLQKMEAIGRLAGGIAHDFNTLLGSITGYSEMLLEGLPAGDPRRRAAEQILRCSDRGAQLTGQMLAFSRKHPIEKQAVDVQAILGQIQDMLDRLVGDDVELIWNLEAKRSVVKADPGQVEQLIMNLVINAADALPRGGHIHIDLENINLEGTCPFCGACKPSGPHLHLCVRDDGQGMDEDTLGHIFEPFFTTKAPGKGTGLGLSTVYAIVHEAGGCVSAESQPQKGATFQILLPLTATDTPVQPAEEPKTEAVDDRGTEILLVVEDDEIFRQLICEILRAKGYTVYQAENPTVALELVERNALSLDLLVSDIVMPDMPGTELARQLSERFPGLKTLMMSGYNSEDLKQRGAGSDSATWIKKPFSTRQLVRRVRQLLDS